MKAITLWQPWATLIAIGAKRFETRHWPTDYRGPLAIHAAKRPVDPDEWHPPIYGALREAGYGWPGRIDALEIPYGCIVCAVDLMDCCSTESAHVSSFWRPGERSFGDYTPGRFAWRLANVRQINNIPARGSQGFWEWEPAQGLALPLFEAQP